MDGIRIPKRCPMKSIAVHLDYARGRRRKNNMRARNKSFWRNRMIGASRTLQAALESVGRDTTAFKKTACTTLTMLKRLKIVNTRSQQSLETVVRRIGGSNAKLSRIDKKYFSNLNLELDCIKFKTFYEYSEPLRRATRRPTESTTGCAPSILPAGCPRTAGSEFTEPISEHVGFL